MTTDFRSDRSDRTLSRLPALLPLLARGALLSPLKRPRSGGGWSSGRLVVPGVRVDPGRLAAYERVCGFPTGADALPLTYPHVLAFPLAMRLMGGRDFPLPLLGLVHTSVEITRWQPTSAHGEYELAVHVEALAPHRRGTEATVVTEARTGGELVWESRSTYLARHRTPDGRQDGRAQRPPSPAAPPSVARWRLGADVGRRYAAVSGDRNPIHLHPLTARLFGFPRPLAHGMWTAARCLAAHGTPERVRAKAEFRAPVLLPGTVTYAADGGRFELRSGERLHVGGVVDDLSRGAR
jgi:acyl dehydratase